MGVIGDSIAFLMLISLCTRPQNSPQGTQKRTMNCWRPSIHGIVLIKGCRISLLEAGALPVACKGIKEWIPITDPTCLMWGIGALD